jgi:hypothetical protein
LCAASPDRHADAHDAVLGQQAGAVERLDPVAADQVAVDAADRDGDFDFGDAQLGQDVVEVSGGTPARCRPRCRAWR